MTSVTSPVNGLGISARQQTAIEYLYGTHEPAAITDSAAAAEFQMALWTLLYSPTYSAGAGSGVIYSNNPNIATADGWAANAWGHIGTQVSVYALIARPDDTQSFSVAIVSGAGHDNTAPVPLPAAVGVGFSMLGGFGMLAGLRKRLRRRPRIA